MSMTSTAAPAETIHVVSPPRRDGQPDARPPRDVSPQEQIDWMKFGLLTAELVGVLCLIQRFRIENEAFFELSLLVAGGFVAHYLMPLRYRMGFFLCLSLLSIGLVFGAVPGAWLIAFGLALVGIAHLPISVNWRVALLIAAGLALAMLRTTPTLTSLSTAIWPILSAMFMFRLIVYMYDLKHGQVPNSWTQRLSYFFMLPNVCFPLFPVIDSRTFIRTYYDNERHEIHQRGMEWMLRGIVQLILYRLVYQRMVIDPNDVANAADLVQHFLSLFLLYLRVSGQFHLIIGILHLFGFHLGETHRLYYFASSFTDFWRRINIYWKDFMMKVFYYPMFFRTRTLGPTLALVVSTAWVFALTWALHAYQLFWIRGDYQFMWNDVLFWTILCGLVTINALWEARFGRRRVLGNRRRSWTDHVVVVIKTAATFSVICVLWSFWSSDSLEAWFSLWPAALVQPAADQMRTLINCAGSGLVALGLFWAWLKWGSEWVNRRFARRCVVVLAQLFVINAVSISAIHSRLGGTVDELVVTAQTGGLNRLDKALQERGYYEGLLTVDRFGELAALYGRRPADWMWLHQSDIIQATAVPGLRYELRSNYKSTFKGASFRTNRWGMHDRDYTRDKPVGCYRIAILGASHTMGSGVERHQTFDAVLERNLNQRLDAAGDQRIEVLNFGVGGYYQFEQIQVLEEKVVPFRPDAVFYVGHPGEAGRVVHYLAQIIQAGGNVHHPFLSELIQRAGVNKNTPKRLLHQKLQPLAEDVLSWLYRELATRCAEHQIHPVFVRLPLLNEKPYDDSKMLVGLARNAGFTVFNLDGVYEGPEPQTLWIAEWDNHPNAQGHQMVGDRLYQLVHRTRTQLGLPSHAEN